MSRIPANCPNSGPFQANLTEMMASLNQRRRRHNRHRVQRHHNRTCEGAREQSVRPKTVLFPWTNQNSYQEGCLFQQPGIVHHQRAGSARPGLRVFIHQWHGTVVQTSFLVSEMIFVLKCFSRAGSLRCKCSRSLCVFFRSSKKAAQGIDIEPDFAEYTLVNITLRRLLLEKNDGHGFQLVLREFARRPADVPSPITLTLEDVRVKGSFSPTSVRAPALLSAVLFLST